MTSVLLFLVIVLSGSAVGSLVPAGDFDNCNATFCEHINTEKEEPRRVYSNPNSTEARSRWPYVVNCTATVRDCLQFRRHSHAPFYRISCYNDSVILQNLGACSRTCRPNFPREKCLDKCAEHLKLCPLPSTVPPSVQRTLSADPNRWPYEQQCQGITRSLCYRHRSTLTLHYNTSCYIRPGHGRRSVPTYRACENICDSAVSLPSLMCEQQCSEFVKRCRDYKAYSTMSPLLNANNASSTRPQPSENERLETTTIDRDDLSPHDNRLDLMPDATTAATEGPVAVGQRTEARDSTSRRGDDFDIKYGIIMCVVLVFIIGGIITAVIASGICKNRSAKSQDGPDGSSEKMITSNQITLTRSC